jgi:ABC-2 type transport system permease protein
MTTTASPNTAVEPEPVLAGATLRAALAVRERPEKPSAIGASFTFAWRAMLKIKHVPMQLFDVTMFPVMFVLLFTYLFGGALAGSPSEYLQLLLPGILVMAVTMITIYTGMALNNDVHKGIFDRFRSLPIWRPAVLVGMLLADVVRYTLASIVVLALGIVLGFRPDGGPLGVLAGVALILVFSFSLSWIWTAIGLRMQTPESVMQVSMTVLFPLTFASNVFVDPDTMPGWVQAFVRVNPITHVTTATRELMHGSVQMDEIGIVLAWCVALVAIFAPLTMRLYNSQR